MSNPRDLLPNMPGTAPAETNEQKEIKARADQELKKWNEKIRQLYFEHYNNKSPNYIYRYHFKDSFNNDELNLSGQNTISIGSSLIHKLEDGRYTSEPNRGFDIVVERGSVRTSPKPNGRGPKAYKDAWATTFDFLKQAGATNAYVSIEDFKGYNSEEIYQTAKIILKAAVHAQIGVTFDANFTNAIEGMDLKRRDKLNVLHREANFSHIGRKEIIFRYCYEEHQPVDDKGKPVGEPGLQSYKEFATGLTNELLTAGDDTDAKLKLIEEKMVGLQLLEKFIERAEAELQEYAETIKAIFSDRKASDADVDLMKQYTEQTQDIRDKLMGVVGVAREQAEKARDILTKELDVLAPPSEIKKPDDPAEAPVASSSVIEALENEAVADNAGIELAASEKASEITSDKPTSDSQIEELAKEESSESHENPVTDPSLGTTESKSVDSRGSDKKAEANPRAEGAGAGVPSDTSANEAKESAAKSEKPKLSESQEKQIAASRSALEKGRAAEVIQKRREAYDKAVIANKSENIKALYEERKKMHHKPQN